MKFKTGILITFIIGGPTNLFASAAYYVAPLCIGVSFAGAFSWSLFRQPTRTPITRDVINPVVLTPAPKKIEFIQHSKMLYTRTKNEKASTTPLLNPRQLIL